jgi:hypothetical protein
MPRRGVAKDEAISRSGGGVQRELPGQPAPDAGHHTADLVFQDVAVEDEVADLTERVLQRGR